VPRSKLALSAFSGQNLPLSISQATYLNGKTKNDGTLPLNMNRLKQAGGRNTNLWKLVAAIPLIREHSPKNARPVRERQLMTPVAAAGCVNPTGLAGSEGEQID